MAAGDKQTQAVSASQAGGDPGSEAPRSSAAEQSINRILDATLESVTRQGLRHLSMSDVCRRAGVARGTLYRYFPSKEALLEALGQRTRQRTEAGIREAAAACEGGREKLLAVTRFLTDFADETRARPILETEPLFFMDFLRRHLIYYSAVIAEVLEPFFAEFSKLAGYELDRKLSAELILRLQISYIFLPDSQPRENLLEAVMTSLTSAHAGQ